MKKCLVCLAVILAGCGLRNAFAEDKGDDRKKADKTRAQAKSAADASRHVDDSDEAVLKLLNEARAQGKNNHNFSATCTCSGGVSHVVIVRDGTKLERDYKVPSCSVDAVNSDVNGVSKEIVTIKDGNGKVLDILTF